VILFIIFFVTYTNIITFIIILQFLTLIYKIFCYLILNFF